MTTYKEQNQLESSFAADTKKITDGEFNTVLVLYTGGTIGMRINSKGVYSSEKDYLHNWLSRMPSFHNPAYAEQHHHMVKDPPFYSQFHLKPLFMPVTVGSETKYIEYIFVEYVSLIDSSNIDYIAMLQIALDIKKYYKKFNGFVILHGTDTMCYTAAALSFVLENLGKPVIITGSQIPIYETRSDGRDNFQGALIMASKFVIPEVCIYFDNYLLRGNRSRKVSADTLDAFDSPNYPPLGKVEVNLKIFWDLVQRPSATKRFNVHTMLCENVAILRIFPNISADVVRAFLKDPIQGVVMQCYGAGNFPDANLELLEVLKEACDRGVIIVNTTQCRRGAVSISYEGAKSLLDVGIVPGYDMTSEAALTKLSYTLTKPWSIEEKRKFISQNVVGELTTKEGMPKNHPLSAALESLGLKSYLTGVDTENELRETLVMPLMCYLIKRGDLESLGKLCEQFPGNLLMTDYDQRTALHVAVRDGPYDVVKYLINNGAVVHAKDRFSMSPLLEAVRARRYDVIELLIKTGADLNYHPEDIATEMNQAASRGDFELVKAFWNAKAKLDLWDYSKRTSLHVAVLNWHVNIVEFLVLRGANPLLCDDAGNTPLSLTCHQKIISLLEDAIDKKLWEKMRKVPSGRLSELASQNSQDNTGSAVSKTSDEGTSTT